MFCLVFLCDEHMLADYKNARPVFLVVSRG